MSERPSNSGSQVLLMRRLLLLAGSLVILPTLAQAQRGMRSGMSPMPAGGARSVASAPHVSSGAFGSGARVVSRPGSATAGRPMLVIRTPRRAGAPIQRNGASPATINDGFMQVPGLGFDFPHLAAINGSRNGRRHQRGFGSFIPFFDGGFFLPISPTIIEEAPPAESSVLDGSDAEPAQVVRRARAPEAPAAAPAEAAPAPVRDADQFVFVRRDGTVFFAVAYAWENGALRYVTPEGLRRIVARDALDLAATQQFNEQRGLVFQRPV